MVQIEPSRGQLVLEGSFVGESKLYATMNSWLARISLYRPVGIDEESIVERVGTDGYFSFYGTALANIAADQPTIEGGLWGTIEYCEQADNSKTYIACATGRVSCLSREHRLKLVRQ